MDGPTDAFWWLRKTYNRTHKDFLDLARQWADNSPCGKRKVGCVLTRRNSVQTCCGYNYTYLPCDCKNMPTGSNTCKAAHAEIRALTLCDFPEEIENCYLTLSPCYHCAKSLLATSCKRIFFLAHCGDEDAERIWKEAKKEWQQLSSQ